jgi:hypothetical protein
MWMLPASLQQKEQPLPQAASALYDAAALSKSSYIVCSLFFFSSMASYRL